MTFQPGVILVIGADDRAGAARQLEHNAFAQRPGLWEQPGDGQVVESGHQRYAAKELWQIMNPGRHVECSRLKLQVDEVQA
jgi:hypothetical protein